MSTTPFVDALRAAHAHRLASGTLLAAVPRLTTHELLGAVMLDHAPQHLDPSDLLQGTTVIGHDDATVTDAVMACLRRIYGGDGMLLLGYGQHDAAYDQAIIRGVPVVVVTWDRLGVMPHEAVLLADRDHELAEACDADVVMAFVHAVTGGTVDVDGDDTKWLTADSLLRCVQLHSTADDCQDRLQTWSRHVRLLGDGKPKAVEAPAKVGDPVTVASAVQGVVRRLSEMKGFGEAGVWGVNLARDLRDYAAGRLAWSDVDKGILLSGPPGGGKTTFAKALALECEVELVPTTYNDWSAAGGSIGDSMSKGMTKLFDQWRKKGSTAPIILFVDEIDTIGRRGGNGNNESWFTSVINAWLAFLDGAVPRDGIVVVAATNHPERVDPALRRPGRLDRHVELPMPDVTALTSIVRAHLGADAVLTQDELAEAARACRGRSPAEIGLLAREARRIARWCGRRVCASDLTDVVAMGRADEVPETMRRIAVHEAGHAVAGVLLDADTLTCVDLDAGRTSYTRLSIDTPTALDRRLVMMLAARAAEQVLLGEVSTGCARDLEDATLLVSDMRATWGMGDAGLVSIATAATVHDPRHQAYVRRTLDAAYVRAVELMTDGRDAVERVAEALLRQRYLDADEVRALVAGPVAGPPRVRRTAPSMGGAIKRVVGRRGTGPNV